jgi:hypothetical protein
MPSIGQKQQLFVGIILGLNAWHKSGCLNEIVVGKLSQAIFVQKRRMPTKDKRSREWRHDVLFKEG